MREGGTSIRRKERSNFSLHLFCLFWHNFEGKIIKLPKVFCSVFVKIFQCRQTTTWLLIFIFNVFNQFSKKSYAKYGKNTDLQTYFSEKSIWRSSQVFRGIAAPNSKEKGLFN